MKQHPFRLRLPHRLVSSVQFRFAVTFTILVAILLALMNTYPTRASRDIVFTEKQSALTNRAAVVSSSLSLLDNLTPDNTRQVLALLDLRDLTRIIVTDSEGLAVYDSASENNIRGKYVLYPELVRALDGQAVFYSHYTTGAFLSRAAMPVMNSGRTVGAVYVCESDSERAALIGSIQRRLATITIGIGAAALVVLWFSIKMLTRRITQLADGVRTVQRGDYSFQKDGKSYHFSTGSRPSGSQSQPQRQYQPPQESRPPVRRPEAAPVREPAKKENGKSMKTVKKSIIPLACVAAMWLGHALNGGLSSVGGIIRCAVLSAIAFAVLRIFFPDKLVDAQKEPQPAQKKAVPQPEPEKKAAPEPQPAPAAEKPAAKTELEEVLQQGRESIAEIRRLNDEIPDFKISAQLKQLEILTEKIFAFVEQHPEVVRQIRQFLNFYLPTTIKLLQQYVVLQNQEMRMGNIDEGMQKIENMLENVIVAFQKQLDSLFESDVVDITADIQVMEQLMAAEGLTGEKIPVER